VLGVDGCRIIRSADSNNLTHPFRDGNIPHAINPVTVLLNVSVIGNAPFDRFTSAPGWMFYARLETEHVIIALKSVGVEKENQHISQIIGQPWGFTAHRD